MQSKDDWLSERDEKMWVECVHRQGCGDMQYPRAIFSNLTSLTVTRTYLLHCKLCRGTDGG